MAIITVVSLASGVDCRLFPWERLVSSSSAFLGGRRRRRRRRRRWGIYGVILNDFNASVRIFSGREFFVHIAQPVRFLLPSLLFPFSIRVLPNLHVFPADWFWNFSSLKESFCYQQSWFSDESHFLSKN